MDATIVEDGDLEMQAPTKTSYDAAINIIVPNSELTFFNEWIAEIREVVSSYTGFLNRQVHPISSQGGYTEYVVVLVFDSYKNYAIWMDSEDRISRVQQLSQREIKASVMNTYGGNLRGSKETGGGVYDATTPEPTRFALQNSSIKIPRPLPPPKWKLTLLIVVCVYGVLLVTISSGQVEVMAQAGLPSGFITFILLCQIVPVLMYSLIPLLNAIPFVSKWLKYRNPSTPEEMTPIHRVFDQGLAIFAAKENGSKLPSPDLTRRLERLESNVTRLRSVCNTLDTELAKYRLLGDHQHDNGGIMKSDAETESLLPRPSRDNYVVQALQSKIQQISTSSPATIETRSRNTPITMAVKHYVKWEAEIAFEQWTDRMDDTMKK
jgi:antibiotic biosynthesis monooxygenase (ABM) superfamily enzyme